MTRAADHVRKRPFGDVSAYPPDEDEDLYGPLARELDTPENRRKAARQWDAIPTDLTELRKWMRGETIDE